MVQEDPMIANEGKFRRVKQELTRNNVFARSAFETEIGISIKASLCVVRCHLSTILVSFGIVKRRKDQSGSELAFVNQVPRDLVVAVDSHRKCTGKLFRHPGIKVMRAFRLDR